MTQIRRARSALPHPRVRVVLLLGAALLLPASSVLAAAVPPAPTPPTAIVDPRPTPTPALTFAPLVTPPPIVVPAAVDRTGLTDGYSVGRPDAPVTMEVWEDFQCPYCRIWTLDVEPGVLDRYVRTGLVRLTYRPMAFLGEESQWAAVAADLAAEQGRFWAFHDLLFANQGAENNGSLGLDRLLLMGEAAGLDMDALRAGLVLDAARTRFAALIARSDADAATLGIGSTPTVVVDGTPLAAPDLDSIVAAVGHALGVPAASPAPAVRP